MSVEKLSSRIIKYRLYDEISSGVLYYTLDLDKYSLSIDVDGKNFPNLALMKIISIKQNACGLKNKKRMISRVK